MWRSTILSFVIFAHTAFASPELTERLANDKLEAVANGLEALISRASFGNCPRVFLKAKSVNRDESQPLTQDVNELLARVSPDDMSYIFGLLSRREPSGVDLGDSLLALADPAYREEERETVAAVAREMSPLLDGSIVQYLAGTAFFTKVSDDKSKISSGEYSVRVILDTEKDEFLLFATGICESR